MAVGGARPGAGRKPGPTSQTLDLERRVAARLHECGDSVVTALGEVVDDATVPTRIRLMAVRSLGAVLVGRLAKKLRDEGKSFEQEVYD